MINQNANRPPEVRIPHIHGFGNGSRDSRLPSGFDPSDELFRRILDLTPPTATLGLSGLLAAVIRMDDPTVKQLVASALPPDTDLKPLIARVLNRPQKANVGSEENLTITPSAQVALAHANQLIHALPEQPCFVLLWCFVMEAGSAEKADWHPLNFERLTSGCMKEFSKLVEQRQSLPTAQSRKFAAGNGFHWENLTETVRAVETAPVPAFVTFPHYVTFFDSLYRALHRVSPRHVLLIRERGVAERATLIELARRGIQGRPAFLDGKQFIMMDCRHLAAQEIPPLMDAIFVKSSPAEHIVLCLDGLGHLFQSGNVAGNRSFFVSIFSRLRCRVIGILSPQEYEEFISGDGELLELFSPIRLLEPPTEVAVELVRHFAYGMEAGFRVQIDDEAVHRAVILSDSYILHERLPYKAIKVLNAICEDLEYDRSQRGVTRSRVTEADVLAKISELSGVPESTLAGVGEGIDYHKAFSDVILGQEHAVNEVATELGLIKAGMIDPGKPASVMMFVGQTGTGKTEMAKALAQLYSTSKRLKTFTLGNFSEPHSVSGIIGVPAGYVGHERGGRLINELNSDPYGVFLLDEADKAHPDVMQPFLNLFDEGWVADQKGAKAYANRAIFILTTNVGQRQISDMCRAGKSIDEITTAMKESLSRIRHTKSNRPVFSAEFLARIKRIIVFRSLDKGAMPGICRRLLAELQREWSVKRRKELVIPAGLADAIGEMSYALDEKSRGKEGGRIVRKLLADLVESPIQSAISAAPDAYRRSTAVEIKWTGDRAESGLTRDSMQVRFTGAT